MSAPLDIVFLGLSITSSWGNGHAVTYRGLVRELCRAGHRVLFLERDVPWYAENRDLPAPPFGRTALYRSLDELRGRFAEQVREADLVVVGSYVPDGVAVGEWALSAARGRTAFYDIDTPVTLANVRRGECGYLTAAQVPRYDLYLSFTGGPLLERIERELGARRARPLYCSCDPEEHRPAEVPLRWDLGYLGTYSADRQPALEALLVEPARRWPAGRFAVVGPMFPPGLRWPANVDRSAHLSPREHRGFYGAQRFTLNVTRADMVQAGWSPSVRLFEAAACGTPVVSDRWPGIEDFFRPGEELLLARSSEEALAIVRDTPEAARRRIGAAARRRVLAEHTAAHRARALEGYLS
ncbi:CgeB family protein [Anaeromyxobacter paludicola]|uniref:Glycosyl transferase n=1 Tax=Anaeromyxobacter paludicola TaxID=2918171 RepID=A0ABN6N666_9BACT|nr:glycosyltransferase [Anaeromyxobacter paludicola]BDG07485.1 glycosyl transferase [Anaeromyxobacter paludicola]